MVIGRKRDEYTMFSRFLVYTNEIWNIGCGVGLAVGEFISWAWDILFSLVFDYSRT